MSLFSSIVQNNLRLFCSHQNFAASCHGVVGVQGNPPLTLDKVDRLLMCARSEQKMLLNIGQKKLEVSELYRHQLQAATSVCLMETNSNSDENRSKLERFKFKIRRFGSGDKE